MLTHNIQLQPSIRYCALHNIIILSRLQPFVWEEPAPPYVARIANVWRAWSYDWSVIRSDRAVCARNIMLLLCKGGALVCMYNCMWFRCHNGVLLRADSCYIHALVCRCNCVRFTCHNDVLLLCMGYWIEKCICNCMGLSCHNEWHAGMFLSACVCLL